MNAHWVLYLCKFKGEEKYTSASLYCSNCKDAPIERSFYPIKEHYCNCCGAHMIEEPVVEIKEYNNNTVYNWE